MVREQEAGIGAVDDRAVGLGSSAMMCRVEGEDFRAAGDADDAVDGAKICGKSAVVGSGADD